MTIASSATDAQRYPIGRFERPSDFTADQRAAFVARIAALPGNLAAALAGISDGALNAPIGPMVGRSGNWCIMWPTVT